MSSTVCHSRRFLSACLHPCPRRSFLTMKASLAVALLCAAGLVFPCAYAQQSEAPHKQFLEIKAKAEKGDAGAQADLGDMYHQGSGVLQDDVEAARWLRK